MAAEMAEMAEKVRRHAVDDHEMTLSLAADMRALLPVVRHHITMLSTPATARQDPTAGTEIARLAGAMADVCAQAEADDCALILYALHDRFVTPPGPLQPRFAAAVLDAVTFVQERVETMGAFVSPRTPTGVQRAQAERFAQTLAETPNVGYVDADAPSISSGAHSRPPLPESARQMLDSQADTSGADAAQPIGTMGEGETQSPTNDDEGEPGERAESLTEDELAMLQSFQASALRQPERDPFAASSASATEEDGSDGRDAQPPASDVVEQSVSGDAADDAADDAATTPVEAVATASASGGVGSAWGMPTAEELDFIPPEMKQLFLVETSDDAQDLRLALLRYEQRPDDPAPLAALGRITHKIKGAAATLGFDVLAGVLYSFEDVIKGLQSRRIRAGADANAALVREVALLQAALDAAEAGTPADPSWIQEARRLYEALLPESADVPVAARAAAVPGLPAVDDTAPLDTGDVAAGSSAEGESYLRVDVRRLDELMRHISTLAVNRAALTQTREEAVRVQSEMDLAFGQLAALASQLTDLQPILRSPTAHAMRADERAARDAGREAGGSGGRFHFLGRGDSGSHGMQNSRPVWDALEMEQFTEFDHALRKLNEVVADVDTTSRQLRSLLLRLSQLSEEQSALAIRMQRDVMHVRLVPLSSIVPRIDLEARRLASQRKKTIAFSVSGEMTEIDRNISESVAGPLLQLVRNAVVHGIEPPEERRELGKPETGQVWMRAYYVGSEVIIEVGDDGRGINPNRLTASAVAADVLDAETARTLAPSEALELMFKPGVTTFPGVHAVGGRGIGLDEVRTKIVGMKGSITVRSEPGQGTIFRMRVPISLSIVRVLRVSAADQEYAVPFSAVQRTLSISASELIITAGQPETRLQRRIRIERTEDTPVVGELPEDQRYEEIAVFALAELLGVEHEMRDPQMALLVEVGRRRVALLVDGVFEDQEVVVQALPPHLRRRALRGASVTPGGQLLLLLDLPELIAGALEGTQAPQALRPRQVHPATLAPRVLVVDDSISIRRTLEHTLQRSGFEVRVARDGFEALEMMLAAPPRVLVLDIEMPRLDGFELLSIVRESPQFAGVRVAMLTSRAAEKHKEHARQLGAEAYLVKPCPQETLVETVRSLLAVPAAVIY